MDVVQGKKQLKEKIEKIYDERNNLKKSLLDIETQIIVLDIELDKLLVLYNYNEQRITEEPSFIKKILRKK